MFIYLENIFFFLRKKVNCCGLGRMLWPSHADFWGAGSGHRGAARSWPAFRCPWAEVTAEPPRRLCRLQPVLSGGQALLARFPGGTLACPSLRCCAGPRVARREVRTAPPRPSWAQPRRSPGSTFGARGGFAVTISGATVGSSHVGWTLPVWIVHLATPDHQGGRTFCDIFPRLLRLVHFHGNRVQMREPRAEPGAGEGPMFLAPLAGEVQPPGPCGLHAPNSRLPGLPTLPSLWTGPFCHALPQPVLMSE